MKKVIAYIILVLVFHPRSQGQHLHPEVPLNFEQISVNEGLSQSTGRVIIQDRKGFMWIGTQDGLNRYDGYDFKIYNNNPLDSNSLLDNFIISLHEDREGYIWIGTNGKGLNRLDPDTDEFTHFTVNPEDSNSLENGFINDIYEDRSGDLWIGTMRCLERYDKETGHFEHIYLHSDPEIHVAVNHIFEDRKGHLWISTMRTGLIKLDPETATVLERFSTETKPLSLSGNAINMCYEDHKGDLWVSILGVGIDRIDLEKNKISHYDPDPGDANSLASANFSVIMETTMPEDTSLWIATLDQGIHKYNACCDNFTRYQNDPVNPLTLPNNIIFSLYQSRDGILWIGTGGSGIVKCNLSESKFIPYRNPSGQLSNFIWAILEDTDNRVLIGTQGAGIYYFNRLSLEFEPWIIDPSDPAASTSYNVQAIRKSPEGTLWIATFNSGLFRIDRDQGRYEHYTANSDDSTSISGNSIRSMILARDGGLWLGMNGSGLDYFDPRTGTFKNHGFDPGDPTSLSASTIFSLFEDSRGRLWVGTAGGGINLMEDDPGVFRHFQFNNDDSSSLSNNRIRSFHEDQNGGIWIGTDHGLNRFNEADQTFRVWTTKHGLPNNVIYAILEDEEGYFWLSTNHGLCHFDPEHGVLQNYDAEDGLQSNEFNTGAYYQAPDGEIFLGGIRGFNIFHPEEIRDNPYIPPVVITDFRLFNQPVKARDQEFLQRDISEMDRIVLDHDQNFVSFEFAAFSYQNPEKNQYRYKLLGLDKDWVEAGNRRFADYPDLKPGKYTFRVIASNNDGIWNEEGVRLDLVINPPWWKSSPAYVLYIVLLLAAVWLYTRIRVYKLKKAKERLEKQVRERTAEIERQKEEIATQRDALEELNASKDKLFTIIGHDLKNPLTALMSITQSISENYQDLDEKDKEKSLRQILKTTRELDKLLLNLLDWTRAQTGRIPFAPSVFDLQMLVKESLAVIHPAANNKNIEIRHDLEAPVEVYADRNMIATVLRNLLSNAIKFSKSGSMVRLSVEQVDSGIKIGVHDQGLGIPEERARDIFKLEATTSTPGTEKETGTGLGLLICKDFVEKNQGKIWLESQQGKGSDFYFTLQRSPGSPQTS